MSAQTHSGCKVVTRNQIEFGGVNLAPWGHRPFQELNFSASELHQSPADRSYISQEYRPLLQKTTLGFKAGHNGTISSISNTDGDADDGMNA